MADDDGGDWFSSAGKEEPVAEATEPVETEKKPVAEDEFLDPDRLLLCKHWVRPKFSTYRYLYDYRQNYYDDVIDYLNKRQRGMSRDVPRPQTWAERVLRNQATNRTDFFRKIDEDTKLVTKTRLSGAFHSYHSRQYINRRYTTIL